MIRRLAVACALLALGAPSTAVERCARPWSDAVERLRELLGTSVTWAPKVHAAFARHRRGRPLATVDGSRGNAPASGPLLLHFEGSVDSADGLVMDAARRTAMKLAQALYPPGDPGHTGSAGLGSRLSGVGGSQWTLRVNLRDELHAAGVDLSVDPARWAPSSGDAAAIAAVAGALDTRLRQQLADCADSLFLLEETSAAVGVAHVEPALLSTLVRLFASEQEAMSRAVVVIVTHSQGDGRPKDSPRAGETAAMARDAAVLVEQWTATLRRAQALVLQVPSVPSSDGGKDGGAPTPWTRFLFTMAAAIASAIFLATRGGSNAQGSPPSQIMDVVVKRLVLPRHPPVPKR